MNVSGHSTAANNLGRSDFLISFFFLILCERPPTNVMDSMLRMSISAAVSKKSQQRLTLGCQLKEDTNYLACI